MIVTIHIIHCLHNDSNIGSGDIFWHLHILSHQVLHQFGFIWSWINYRISSWQKIISIARKYQMSWNFETKNCSQRFCGVKWSGVSASFPTAKRGVLAECTGSRGLQIDCPPNSLSRIKISLVPGSPSSDFRAGMVDCEALKIKKFIFFVGMDQQSLCSCFQFQHPGSAVWTWNMETRGWSQGSLVLRQPDSQPCPLSSWRHHSREPRDSHLPWRPNGAPRSPRANSPMPWLGGLGRCSCLSLSSFSPALSPCHSFLKPFKFLWERCLRPAKSIRNLRCFSWRISVKPELLKLISTKLFWPVLARACDRRLVQSFRKYLIEKRKEYDF